MCLGGYEYLCVVLNISCVEKNKNIKRRGGGGCERSMLRKQLSHLLYSNKQRHLYPKEKRRGGKDCSSIKIHDSTNKQLQATDPSTFSPQFPRPDIAAVGSR